MPVPKAQIKILIMNIFLRFVYFIIIWNFIRLLSVTLNIFNFALSRDYKTIQYSCILKNQYSHSSESESFSRLNETKQKKSRKEKRNAEAAALNQSLQSGAR